MYKEHMVSVKKQVWKKHMDWSGMNCYRHSVPGTDFTLVGDPSREEESGVTLVWIYTMENRAMRVYSDLRNEIRNQIKSS
jgi:hypothetical protein